MYILVECDGLLFCVFVCLCVCMYVCMCVCVYVCLCDGLLFCVFVYVGKIKWEMESGLLIPS